MTAVFEDGVVAAAVARGLDAVRDLPQAADGDCSAEGYALLGRDFQSSAWVHLNEGDLPQASNKAWGLVAETVKAVSLHHGRVIHTHRGLARVVVELARLPGNAGDADTQRWILNSFDVARIQHGNFYENRAHEDVVLAGLMLCEELSARLYSLFWREGAAIRRRAAA